METLSDTSTLAKRPPAPKTIHRWFIAIPFLVAIVWSLIGPVSYTHLTLPTKA